MQNVVSAYNVAQKGVDDRKRVMRERRKWVRPLSTCCPRPCRRLSGIIDGTQLRCTAQPHHQRFALSYLHCTMPCVSNCNTMYCVECTDRCAWGSCQRPPPQASGQVKRSFGQTLWRRRQLGTIKIVDKVETEDSERPGVLHITLQVLLSELGSAWKPDMTGLCVHSTSRAASAELYP